MVNTHKAIAAALSMGWLGLAMPATAYPELRFLRLQLDTDREECVNQAYEVLRREGFQDLKRFSSANGYFYAVGYRQNSQAIVDCSRYSHRQTQATIMVAGASDRDLTVVSELATIIYRAMSDSTATTAPTRDSFSRSPMANETFARFIKALQDSWPRQMEFLSQPARESYFTSEQVRQIITVFNFPQQQEEAAVMLYPRVVDKSNWFVVYDTFSFDSTRDSVRRRIEQKR